MSTERELLEFAAKAAGIDAEFHPELGYGPEGMWLKGERSPDNSKYWNPLTNDGDALRLGVKVKAFGNPDFIRQLGSARFSMQDQDDTAAYRRAIVCVAAAIGEKMP